MSRASSIDYRVAVVDDLSPDIKVGFVLAYLASFASPRVAAELMRASRITADPRHRATDTGIIIYELLCDGLDGERGKRMVELLRTIHRGIRCPPNDFLFVLVSLIVVPARWCARFGRRAMTSREQEGSVSFFAELGAAMDLTVPFASFEQASSFYDAYLEREARASDAAMRLMLSNRPVIAMSLRLPAELVSPTLIAMFGDRRISDALGLQGSRVLVSLGALGLRARRLRGRRGTPGGSSFRPGQPFPGTYPDGYRLSDIERAALGDSSQSGGER